MKLRLACLLGFALTAWVMCYSPAQSNEPFDTVQQPSARSSFFKTGKVVQLQLEIGQKEMESLRKEPRTYVTAKLKVDGKAQDSDVSVHLRGSAGSFRHVDDKPSLTINMSKLAAGRTFHGMEKFHLHNSVQDPTYIQELLCGELFRAAGVPAARICHAVVTMNGRKLGFYYLKEGYDKGFLKEHFKDASGNLYDGGFLRDIDQPLQLLSGKGDVADRADLKALLAAAHEPDKAKRFQRLDRLLDVDRFLSMVALEVIAWDWDGYPMKPNNYRVYHEPKRDKIAFIPSGMDQMFSDPNGSILPGFGGVVARAIMDTPQGRERYLASIAKILQTTFRPARLLYRIEELQTALQPALATVDAGAGRDYPNHVRWLRGAIVQRHKSVESQVRQMQPVELVPGQFEQRLRLSSGQKEKLEELRKEFDGKLAKVISGPQLKLLKELQQTHTPRQSQGSLSPGAVLAASVFGQLDRNNDGQASREEMVAGTKLFFDFCDKERKGNLDMRLLQAGIAALLGRLPLATQPPRGVSGANQLAAFLAASVLARADRTGKGIITVDDLQAGMKPIIDEVEKGSGGKRSEDDLANGFELLLQAPVFVLVGTRP